MIKAVSVFSLRNQHNFPRRGTQARRKCCFCFRSACVLSFLHLALASRASAFIHTPVAGFPAAKHPRCLRDAPQPAFTSYAETSPKAALAPAPYDLLLQLWRQTPRTAPSKDRGSLGVCLFLLAAFLSTLLALLGCTKLFLLRSVEGVSEGK